MRKYIAIVTLLAAGTALANAENLTLTSASQLESGNGYVAWSETYTTLESWSLSFLERSVAEGMAMALWPEESMAQQSEQPSVM